MTSLLEIRQNELNLQKQLNQVRVDVQNAVIGLQQARARYDAAVEARKLSQQTFDADKKKYDLGAGTPYQVVQDQRDLSSAQSSEAQAMANYSHARIAFDQASGADAGGQSHLDGGSDCRTCGSARPRFHRGCSNAQHAAVRPGASFWLIGLCWTHAARASAQQAGIEPIRPSAIILWRPYLPTTVPPRASANSDRVKILIQAGKLYLTAHDAIALAIENNIDIESARYSPILSAWNLERSSGGRSVARRSQRRVSIGVGPSGQGVLGSQQAAGVSLAGSRGGAEQHHDHGLSGRARHARVRPFDSGKHHVRPPQQSSAEYRF